MEGLVQAAEELSVKQGLLILDLNGVLLFRLFIHDKPDLSTYPASREKVGEFWAWKRPHVDSFLDFCFERFDVACWSSAAPKNTKPLAEWIFGPRFDDLVFCWDQTFCDREERENPPDGENPFLFKKPLSKVWDAYPRFSSANTILMDDSEEKTQDYRENSFCPPSWNVLKAGDDALRKNGLIRQYLEKK